MKKLISGGAVKSLVAFLMLAFVQVVSFAQDGASTTTTTTKSAHTESAGGDGSFYTQPWVWVVGGAVFILLLIALLRGNSSSKTDRVVVSKTREV